jgi:hypothetical protein
MLIAVTVIFALALIAAVAAWLRQREDNDTLSEEKSGLAEENTTLKIEKAALAERSPASKASSRRPTARSRS